MENNEIMNYENEVIEAEEIETETNTGLGTGLAMLIGGGLTLAGVAGVKVAKKLITKIKAKKAEADVETVDEESDSED